MPPPPGFISICVPYVDSTVRIVFVRMVEYDEKLNNAIHSAFHPKPVDRWADLFHKMADAYPGHLEQIGYPAVFRASPDALAVYEFSLEPGPVEMVDQNEMVGVRVGDEVTYVSAKPTAILLVACGRL